MTGVPTTRIDVFFDTNILAYLFGPETDKLARSHQLVSAGGLVSVQVLNEMALVARRKMRKTWPEVHEILIGLRAKCGVLSINLEVHERGLQYAERYGLSLYDSMIVAAAALAGCTTVYSVDMHDGLVIDGVTIRNPYAG